MSAGMVRVLPPYSPSIGAMLTAPPIVSDQALPYGDHAMNLDSNNKYPSNPFAKDPFLVRTKVEEDIAFLQARIASLENHPRPNRIVLETYQEMLNSRISVLKWLMHGASDAGHNGIAGQRRA
jgi:hypothetical protein